jgi:hypothetical protein
MIRGGTDVMYHGPKLSAWLRERGVVPSHLPARMDRAMRRWANGERATERLVDELCCHLGWPSHLNEIPFEFVVKGRPLVDPDYRKQEAA